MCLANRDFTVMIVPTKNDEIKNYVQKNLGTASTKISTKPDNNTSRSEIKSNREINFKPKDSIGELLGFTPRVLLANKTHTPNSLVAIQFSSQGTNISERDFPEASRSQNHTLLRKKKQKKKRPLIYIFFICCCGCYKDGRNSKYFNSS